MTTNRLPNPVLADPAVQRNFHELDRRLSGVASQTQPSVTAPTLSGTWVNVGAGSQNAGYYKDTVGHVHLTGSVKSGAGTIFTLPVGYRPAAVLRFVANGNDAIARINVDSAGVVSLANGTATVFLTLDGITFRAA